MVGLPDVKDVIEWLRYKRIRFINARRLARKFKISSKSAGYLLRKLKALGYVRIHRRRRGRFIIYRVNESLLK